MEDSTRILERAHELSPAGRTRSTGRGERRLGRRDRTQFYAASDSRPSHLELVDEDDEEREEQFLGFSGDEEHEMVRPFDFTQLVD